MTTATLPSGTGVVSTYTYDNADRLTAISHDKGGTTLASATYTLDNAGNRTQKVDAGGTTTYAYDDDSRLTSVTPPSPASAINYTWDDNGDLTARGSDSFAWDYEDRMVSATVNSVTTTFAYRGDGPRDSRTTGGVTTTFTWDIASGLPVVLDDGSQYVYAASGLVSQKQGGSWYYYLADGLGSTITTVDSAGAVVNAYTYDGYGKTTAASGSQANEFQFAGQQTDGTGLQYLRARYYDPDTGTFLSRDPLAASPTWTTSSYTYALSSPVNYADPTGTCVWILPCPIPDNPTEVLICIYDLQLCQDANALATLMRRACEAIKICPRPNTIYVWAGMKFGEYELSAHAARRMAERGVTPEDVNKTNAAEAV
ncbi:MAG: hypothetical protein HYX53_17960 [Chloroflexi bacterium]|nr:hypothetical protein [Chloroflexota bacterium]